MELVIILAVVFGFALIRTGIEHKTKEREQKLQALQQALQNPSLDRATITALTHQLAGTKPPKEPRGAGRAMAWLLAITWASGRTSPDTERLIMMMGTPASLHFLMDVTMAALSLGKHRIAST